MSSPLQISGSLVAVPPGSVATPESGGLSSTGSTIQTVQDAARTVINQLGSTTFIGGDESKVGSRQTEALDRKQLLLINQQHLLRATEIFKISEKFNRARCSAAGTGSVESVCGQTGIEPGRLGAGPEATRDMGNSGRGLKLIVPQTRQGTTQKTAKPNPLRNVVGCGAANQHVNIVGRSKIAAKELITILPKLRAVMTTMTSSAVPEFKKKEEKLDKHPLACIQQMVDSARIDFNQASSLAGGMAIGSGTDSEMNGSRSSLVVVKNEPEVDFKDSNETGGGGPLLPLLLFGSRSRSDEEDGCQLDESPQSAIKVKQEIFTENDDDVIGFIESSSSDLDDDVDASANERESMTKDISPKKNDFMLTYNYSKVDNIEPDQTEEPTTTRSSPIDVSDSSDDITNRLHLNGSTSDYIKSDDNKDNREMGAENSSTHESDSDIIQCSGLNTGQTTPNETQEEVGITRMPSFEGTLIAIAADATGNSSEDQVPNHLCEDSDFLARLMESPSPPRSFDDSLMELGMMKRKSKSKVSGKKKRKK